MERFAERCFLRNSWKRFENRNLFPSCNPYTRKVLGCVPNLLAEDFVQFSESALSGFKAIRELKAATRAKYLTELRLLLDAESEKLSFLITCETGKPIKESRAEVRTASKALEWFAAEAERINGHIIQSDDGLDRKVVYEPVGPTVLITPWNFPLSMITRSFGAIIAAGCSVVIKPSEDTPLVAMAFAELCERANFPPGVVNVATCARENVEKFGEAVCSDENIAKVAFTGSCEVGRRLNQLASGNIKRVSMELGGNAPFVIFPSADIKSACTDLVAMKMRNCGQACISPNRIYVHDDVYDMVTQSCDDLVKRLKFGDPMHEDTDVGTLISDRAYKKVRSFLDDAESEGHTLSNPNGISYKADRDDCSMSPTFVLDAKHESRIAREEIFGPVFVFIRFSDEERVIEQCNDTNTGLAAYFYSTDREQIKRVSSQLAFGMCGVNTCMISSYLTPFGGMKQSGLGRDSSIFGIKDYLETKAVVSK